MNEDASALAVAETALRETHENFRTAPHLQNAYDYLTAAFDFAHQLGAEWDREQGVLQLSTDTAKGSSTIYSFAGLLPLGIGPKNKTARKTSIHPLPPLRLRKPRLINDCGIRNGGHQFMIRVLIPDAESPLNNLAHHKDMQQALGRLLKSLNIKIGDSLSDRTNHDYGFGFRAPTVGEKTVDVNFLTVSNRRKGAVLVDTLISPGKTRDDLDRIAMLRSEIAAIHKVEQAPPPPPLTFRQVAWQNTTWAAQAVRHVVVQSFNRLLGLNS